MVPMHVERSYSREKVLGDHLKAIANDMRLIDLADLVAYLRTSQFASVGALVQASIELSFRPDTMKFGYSGDVRLEWGGETQVAFDMEFHHQAVHVYFRLMLEPQEAGVEILCISFDDSSDCPDHNTTRLRQALQSARIN
ncbi:MAG: hypothetical protein ABL907_07910 [Hyphomicrobium sp.]